VPGPCGSTAIADLLGGRPRQGPNALAYLERVLSALSAAPGFEDIDAVMLAARTMNAYMIGAIRRELGVRAERESGMNRAAWEAATISFARRVGWRRIQ
jgi:Tetracyclin repressor-like, C-terminal domain